MKAHSTIRGANFMFKNSAEIFAYIKKEDVKLVDVRFTDLPGIQHHFNVPVESFDEAVFTDGLMFDGSSIRGFQSIHESDMILSALRRRL
jgi:glutamine synthetase